MNCEKCQKNHATLHLTMMENGNVREAHLCEECARQAGVGVKYNVPVGAIFDTLVNPKTSKVSKARCPDCGITYAEFKKKARLGCARDYEVFRKEIMKLLERVHGSTTHTGKAPATADANVRKENELLRLKRDLESLVKKEDYEKAAEIRDRIRSLETELNR